MATSVEALKVFVQNTLKIDWSSQENEKVMGEKREDSLYLFLHRCSSIALLVRMK